MPRTSHSEARSVSNEFGQSSTGGGGGGVLKAVLVSEFEVCGRRYIILGVKLVDNKSGANLL